MIAQMHIMASGEQFVYGNLSRVWTSSWQSIAHVNQIHENLEFTERRANALSRIKAKEYYQLRSFATVIHDDMSIEVVELDAYRIPLKTRIEINTPAKELA